MSSVPSEIEKLKEKYKTEAIRIENIGEIKKDVQLVYCDIVRQINITDENILVIHKEYIDKSDFKLDSSNAKSLKTDTLSNLFQIGD